MCILPTSLLNLSIPDMPCPVPYHASSELVSSQALLHPHQSSLPLLWWLSNVISTEVTPSPYLLRGCTLLPASFSLEQSFASFPSLCITLLHAFKCHMTNNTLNYLLTTHHHHFHHYSHTTHHHNHASPLLTYHASQKQGVRGTCKSLTLSSPASDNSCLMRCCICGWRAMSYKAHVVVQELVSNPATCVSR